MGRDICKQTPLCGKGITMPEQRMIVTTAMKGLVKCGTTDCCINNGCSPHKSCGKGCGSEKPGAC